MEERLPPSDDAAASMLPLPLPPGRAHETYVVQIPRENICRVPPSHHASIVAEHTRLAAIKKEMRRKRLHVPYALPIFMFAIVAGMTILTVRATVYRPTPPSFTVTRVQFTNGSRISPEFKFSVHAKNQNPRMSVSYQGGGAAIVIYKNKRIGQGKIPATIKDHANGAADFAVSLAGKVAALSKEIKNKLNDNKEKLIELDLVLPVEMKSWLRNEKMNIKIYCDIWVQNSLMKKPKISLQDCQTLT
ncbi:hypothetical protein C2S52_009386 [Perilla frutescens var. hirtella]|nr:hypothetical protein C2S51_017121 [Perilla frutescens var. frutescens]KAH6784427.1 hypothetical protein C2S52_009386 [Perilla frutescens var. hirtella]